MSSTEQLLWIKWTYSSNAALLLLILYHHTLWSCGTILTGLVSALLLLWYSEMDLWALHAGSETVRVFKYGHLSAPLVIHQF